MKNLCLEAKIPVPQFSCKGNDFWTVFCNDIYNKENLSKLGLNDRQIKAVLYVKEKGQITNADVKFPYFSQTRFFRKKQYFRSLYFHIKCKLCIVVNKTMIAFYKNGIAN